MLELFAHVTHNNSLSEVIFQGTFEGQWRQAKNNLELIMLGYCQEVVFPHLCLMIMSEHCCILTTNASIMTALQSVTGATL